MKYGLIPTTWKTESSKRSLRGPSRDFFSVLFCNKGGTNSLCIGQQVDLILLVKQLRASVH